MRSLDDILEHVDADLKMELIQLELNRHLKKQKTIEEKMKAIKTDPNNVENKTLSHVQRLVDEYYKDKQTRLMFLYETVENKSVFFNVIEDKDKTETELRNIIKSENGRITKKFEVKHDTLFVDDVAMRKIKKSGKTYKLVTIKK